MTTGSTTDPFVSGTHVLLTTGNGEHITATDSNPRTLKAVTIIFASSSAIWDAGVATISSLTLSTFGRYLRSARAFFYYLAHFLTLKSLVESRLMKSSLLYPLPQLSITISYKS